MGNLRRKFAYDGLDHHTLLSARHYERVRFKSTVRKCDFVEGEVEVTGIQMSARAVYRSLQTQCTRHRQPESGFVLFGLLLQWRSV